MARPGFEPTISRSEVNRANSIGLLLEKVQIYLSNILCDETKSESWPVLFCVPKRDTHSKTICDVSNMSIVC